MSFCGNECRWDLNRLDRGSLWEAKENENGARSAFFGAIKQMEVVEKMRAQLTRGLNAQNSEVLPI